MYFVSGNSDITDASLNIALETYLVENRLVDEPILLFYINAPSIIVGRHQNTVAEVNQPYLDEKISKLSAECLAVVRYITIWVTSISVSLKIMTAQLAILLVSPSPSLKHCISSVQQEPRYKVVTIYSLTEKNSQAMPCMPKAIA